MRFSAALRPVVPGVPIAAAAQFSVSVIASLQKESIMNTAISAITRTSRSIRRTVNRIARRLTRKASIKLGLTVSVPPFFKFVLDYKSDIDEAANDNSHRRKPRQTA
jgi:hypothetical protein